MSNERKKTGKGKRLRQRTLIESFSKHKSPELLESENSRRKRDKSHIEAACEITEVETTTKTVKKRKTEDKEETDMDFSHEGCSNDDFIKQRREILANAVEQRRSATPPNTSHTEKHTTPNKSSPHKTDNSPKRQSSDRQGKTSPYFQGSPSAIASTSRAAGSVSPSRAVGPASPSRVAGPASTSRAAVGPASPHRVVGPASPSRAAGNATPSRAVGPATPSRAVATAASPSRAVATASPSRAVATASPSRAGRTASPSRVVGPATPSRVVGTASASQSPVVKKITSDESSAVHSDVSETMEYDASLSLFSDSDQNEFDSQELFTDSPTPSSAQHVSKGRDLTQINRTPGCAAQLPTLTPDKQHVVMIRPHIRSGDPPRPWPDTYKDYWNADHVKMPCSKENLYPVDDGGQKRLLSRWELIQETLLGDIKSTLDLEEAILKYNIRYSNKWDFRGLHCFFTEVLDASETMNFFKTTLPAMIRLALQLPNICTKAPPLLKKQQAMTVTLSQQQVACLLANAFFCTFPRRNARQKQSGYSTYPDINFVQLFRGGKDGIEPRKAEKLKCILNYFKRVTTTVPSGTVSYTRRVLHNMPRWDRLSDDFTDIHVTSKGTIEDDGQGMLQVDFANKYLGGGVLGWGCVQEEIRFLICPEMIISRLFTESLDNNECLVMTGCERFNDYTGYANTFRWTGNYQDTTQRDSWGRLFTEVVAIDAIHFRNSVDQYKGGMVKRETDKAYCGFYGDGLPSENLSAVATGNWGCGAFGGDSRLKALIQMMAASAAKRDLVYFTFDDPKLANDIHSIHTFIKSEGLLIAEVWALIKRYHNDIIVKKKQVSLYEFMYQLYHDYESSTDNDDKQATPSNEPTENRDIQVKGDESPDYARYTP